MLRLSCDSTGNRRGEKKRHHTQQARLPSLTASQQSHSGGSSPDCIPYCAHRDVGLGSGLLSSGALHFRFRPPVAGPATRNRWSQVWGLQPPSPPGLGSQGPSIWLLRKGGEPINKATTPGYNPG